MDMLEAVGIPVSVFNQHGAGAVGELPQDCGWPQLWVHRDEHYQRARELILARESEESASPERACGQCGELNPGSFDICWACGADLPQPVDR